MSPTQARRKIRPAARRRPEEIESLSFRIIAKKLGRHRFLPKEFEIVRRVIHATGDIGFSRTIRFHPSAIRRAIQALRAGCVIITDVRMVAAGISSEGAASLGARVRCFIRHPSAIREAKTRGTTRTASGIVRGAQQHPNAIFVVGNAPTALLALIEEWKSGTIQPPVIIGVPVGFVDASESKRALIQSGCHFITVRGRKGGSAVAVSIINALMKIARR